ncbi:unnamed protein product [Nyctereutes procyonoides]|uniref:(raccoon dog) hypothetical protein n=1 Tax=Nyctereutes procyonoides TaxID=34880 RepID=A0A811ZD11_NYCPR|nr:unnamed protein product [Nyctereutes procyonoides]
MCGDGVLEAWSVSVRTWQMRRRWAHRPPADMGEGPWPQGRPGFGPWRVSLGVQGAIRTLTGALGAGPGGRTHGHQGRLQPQKRRRQGRNAPPEPLEGCNPAQTLILDQGYYFGMLASRTVRK